MTPKKEITLNDEEKELVEVLREETRTLLVVAPNKKIVPWLVKELGRHPSSVIHVTLVRHIEGRTAHTCCLVKWPGWDVLKVNRLLDRKFSAFIRDA